MTWVGTSSITAPRVISRKTRVPTMTRQEKQDRLVMLRWREQIKRERI